MRRGEPLLAVGPEWGKGKKPVLCPVCQFDYQRPVGVEINAGGQVTTMTSKGTNVTKGEPNGRGVTIRIAFACEEGHTSFMEMDFHKGQVLFDFRGVDRPCDLDVIWRD